MNRSLEDLQSDLIRAARRGYPILIAGALFCLVLAVAPLLLPMPTVHLVWIVGLGSIFPSGLLLGKLLGVDLIRKGNPLGTLGGLVAATQAAYLPVFILVYQLDPTYIPFTVGLLGGAHFLPYLWIYRSKAYGFVTAAMCGASFVLGGWLKPSAFTLVPIALFLVFVVGVLWILHENQQESASEATPR